MWWYFNHLNTGSPVLRWGPTSPPRAPAQPPPAPTEASHQEKCSCTQTRPSLTQQTHRPLSNNVTLLQRRDVDTCLRPYLMPHSFRWHKTLPQEAGDFPTTEAVETPCGGSRWRASGFPDQEMDGTTQDLHRKALAPEQGKGCPTVSHQTSSGRIATATAPKGPTQKSVLWVLRPTVTLQSHIP